jgi:hypothetical protein
MVKAGTPGTGAPEAAGTAEDLNTHALDLDAIRAKSGGIVVDTGAPTIGHGPLVACWLSTRPGAQLVAGGRLAPSHGISVAQALTDRPENMLLARGRPGETAGRLYRRWRPQHAVVQRDARTFFDNRNLSPTCPQANESQRRTCRYADGVGRREPTPVNSRPHAHSNQAGMHGPGQCIMEAR